MRNVNDNLKAFLPFDDKELLTGNYIKELDGKSLEVYNFIGRVTMINISLPRGTTLGFFIIFYPCKNDSFVKHFIGFDRKLRHAKI